MTGALVPAPVAVHFKFGGEVAHATVSVPPPATPEAVCAAILEARKDVAAMLKDAYAGFELAEFIGRTNEHRRHRADPA